MMGMGGAGGAGGGADSGAGNSPFVNGGMPPQLLQFASGALSGGGFQGGIGKLMGGLLAQKMKQRMLQQQPQSGNPLDQLLSGDPGANMQPMA